MGLVEGWLVGAGFLRRASLEVGFQTWRRRSATLWLQPPGSGWCFENFGSDLMNGGSTKPSQNNNRTVSFMFTRSVLFFRVLRVVDTSEDRRVVMQCFPRQLSWYLAKPYVANPVCILGTCCDLTKGRLAPTCLGLIANILGSKKRAAHSAISGRQSSRGHR